MPKKTVKKGLLRTANVNLKDFCHFAQENDYIQVTEWLNGEGMDIHISKAHNREDTIISMTYGEFDAICKLVKAIEKMPIP